MQTIRLLDLNIWNYNEPWTVRCDLIVDLILDSQPDLVALQEIRYCDWRLDPRHQADQILAGLPGYRSVWQPAHYWPAGSPKMPGEQQWEGLAILSPHPIVDRAVAHLSRAADDKTDTFQRIVLGAQVRTPGSPLWLFNTHFPLSSRARARVAVEAAEFVTQTAGRLPFVLTGDLNAQPEEPTIRYLSGREAIGGQTTTLIDAWTFRHPDRPGYTYPAWGPQQRIDYVFLSPQIRVQTIEVVGQVEGPEITAPSDHCGLFAVLEAEVHAEHTSLA